MSHHSVMTSSLLIKILNSDKFGDYSCDILYKSKADVFKDVISLLKLINVNPGASRAPPADTKCPSAAQCKHAKLDFIS